ncbi:MAG: hypothetical protein OEV93_02110, partial [Candidatus Moranbacteria bacterium]|nr:hypothetical protein [Candidatus Moranbacteria bacterium]
KRLREFKADLKETYESFGDSNVENAKKKVLDIYAKSVNQTLAEHFRTEVFFDKIKEIDSDFYDDNKEVVKKLFIGTSKKERRYSAYDKFIFGASREYDEDGMRRQIGKELEKYGDEIADAYVENEIRKIEGCREKGLDLKKIEKESVKSETFAGWFEDLLEKQGQLSEDQYSEQDAKRKGAAPDDKWQIDVSSEYGAADVDGKKKLIKLNSSDKSIYKVVATYLGHEWTHVIQNINREKVGLQIFREKMSDRQDVLAEGGAMMIENKISQEAFGFGRVPIPHYLRAMKRKLDGGNYIDCVEAYYNSSLEILRKKKELGLIDEAKFKSSIKAIAKNAVAGPRRLFSNGADLSISGKELPRSRDAVYLEQVRVMEELKKENLENLSLIMGVNLENLVSLAEAGLVDLGDIQEPELYALEIWDEIADDYKSEEAV